MVVLGLTGSIGMGKSTTAGFFRSAGIPVHDSDAAVHRLYDGENARVIEEAFPGILVNGKVDRSKLGQRVLGHPQELRRLESIVHPLIGADRSSFLVRQQREGCPIALLDIPLLFEIGGSNEIDIIVLATASEAVQKMRVLARPGMTTDKFSAILKRQIPDSEKRKKSHFVIDTSFGLEYAARNVIAIIRAIGSIQHGMRQQDGA